LAFGVWRLAFGVWRLAFGVWRLAFGVWADDCLFGQWQVKRREALKDFSLWLLGPGTDHRAVGAKEYAFATQWIGTPWIYQIAETAATLLPRLQRCPL